MSWIERIKTGYTIRTGDGATYTPKWLNPNKSQSFNVSEFNFPNVSGTLVDRRRPKGERYNLELYFDGDDHIDVSAAFALSANNSKAWTITHPIYETLTVQPISIFYDNRDANVTKITGAVIETIGTAKKSKVSAIDKIRGDKVQIDALQANAYAFDVQPTTADITEYKGNLDTLYADGSKSAGTTLDAETYFNAYNAAYSKMDNLISEPLAAVRLAQRMIEAPFIFAQLVQRRFETFMNQVALLRRTLDNVLNRNQKRQYETNVGCIISAMAAATTVNIEGSYKNRVDVIQIADNLANTYNQYIADLDGLQTLTGADADSYIPNFDAVNAIRDLVIFTINNLVDIAVDGRTEITIQLEEDSNAIMLTYRFYGDDPNDTFLTEFIEANNLGLNELLIIPKGRLITYYVENDN